jgi:hypothetical protein
VNYSTRRRWDVVWLACGAALAAGAAIIGALVGDTERIGDYWLHASVDDDGQATVIEVIDYDFGPRSRHGILRDIPGVDPRSAILVSSPSAPADLQVSAFRDGVRLRIGDPDTTVRDRHRYRIEYPIDTLVEGDRVSWNAIGLDWTVPINNVEVHLTSTHDLDELTCSRGHSGAIGGCSVIEVEPGHLKVEVSGLDDGEAVTISGTRRSVLASAPTAPAAPTGSADDPGSGWLTPGLAALGAAVIAGGITSRQVRHLGKEQVWEGGPADAAFGPPSGEVAGIELVDYARLAEMATIEFESPRGLSAAAGGIIHAEGVASEHQMAWLLECAIREEVLLDEVGETLTLRRGSVVPHPAVTTSLDAIFAGRREVALGTYDEEFAEAWGQLAAELEKWRAASELWDPAGHARRAKARGFGFVAMIVGLGTAFLAGVVANRAGSPWLVLAVLGGLISGPGIAGLIRSWELPVRTPEGSARWLQIESFRRFIAASEARHAEAAARMGLLRQYTAWAVALGELDHWSESVTAAAAVAGSPVMAGAADLHFVALAPRLSSSTTQTFTAPSSSGSGGGGGAGGGGGGGGGGSW